MHGRLYYQEPIAWAGTGGDWVCVDLKTGQEIWRNKTMSCTPNFGYYYDLDDMNQHGVVNPGYIFSSNFGGGCIHSPTLWNNHRPLNITNVPSGSLIVIGPKGEVLRYILQNEGTSSSPNWRLFQWNSSKVFTYQRPAGTRNASLAAYITPASTYHQHPYLPLGTLTLSVSQQLTGTVQPSDAASIRRVMLD